MNDALISEVLKSGGWIEIHNSQYGYRASANWETKSFSVCGEGKENVVLALKELVNALKEFRKDWPP